MSGTVKENVQMGYYEHSDEHILDVCKVAGVDAFISPNPASYDLELKERGVDLSGGQRQDEPYEWWPAPDGGAAGG